MCAKNLSQFNGKFRLIYIKFIQNFLLKLLQKSNSLVFPKWKKFLRNFEITSQNFF